MFFGMLNESYRYFVIVVAWNVTSIAFCEGVTFYYSSYYKQEAQSNFQVSV